MDAKRFTDSVRQGVAEICSACALFVRVKLGGGHCFFWAWPVEGRTQAPIRPCFAAACLGSSFSCASWQGHDRILTHCGPETREKACRRHPSGPRVASASPAFNERFEVRHPSETLVKFHYLFCLDLGFMGFRTIGDPFGRLSREIKRKGLQILNETPNRTKEGGQISSRVRLAGPQLACVAYDWVDPCSQTRRFGLLYGRPAKKSNQLGTQVAGRETYAMNCVLDHARNGRKLESEPPQRWLVNMTPHLNGVHQRVPHTKQHTHTHTWTAT